MIDLFQGCSHSRSGGISSEDEWFREVWISENWRRDESKLEGLKIFFLLIGPFKGSGGAEERKERFGKFSEAWHMSAVVAAGGEEAFDLSRRGRWR